MNKKNIDLLLFIAVIVLSIFGTIMIYSSSSIWAEYKFNDPFKYLKAQTIFLILGITIMIIVSKIPYMAITINGPNGIYSFAFFF